MFRAKLGTSNSERWLFAALFAVLMVLIVYPLAMLLVRSLYLDSGSTITLSNYMEMFGSPHLLQTLGNSFFIAVLTTAVSVVAGSVLAWIVVRTDTPGVSFFSNLILVPFFAPSFVGAFAWTILASPRTGLLNQWFTSLTGATTPLFNIYTPWGIVWVLAIVETPLVFMLVANSFRGMSASLEEASRVAGGSLLRTTISVTLPLATPALFGSAILIFVSVLGSFEVPLVLGTPAKFPVLTSEIFAITNETPVRYNLAAAMCSFLFAIALLAILIQNMYLGKRNFVTVAGKPQRHERVKLGRAKYITFAILCFNFLIGVLLPIFALVVASLERFWSGKIRPGLWTLQNFSALADDEIVRNATINTLLLTTVGATIGAAIALAVAYVTYRSKLSGGQLLATISTMPVAVPGAILALGISISWISSPLYGTVWIILIAMIAKFLPYAQRSTVSGISALSKELEESARLSGAGKMMTFRTILFPLLWASVFSGWLLMFIIISRELGMTLFLFTSGTETLPVATYLLMTQRQTATAAICLVQIAVVLLAIILLRVSDRD